MLKWLLAFIICSFVTGFFLINEKRYKDKVLQSGKVCFITLIPLITLWKILEDKKTIYEFVLVGVEVCAAINLFISFFSKTIEQNQREILILKFVLTNVLVIVIYSIFTYGRTCISSDTAIASLLAKSQLKHRCYFPKTWYYGNGDIWVLNPNIFVLLTMFFTKDQSLARVVASISLVMVTVISIIYHSQTSLKSKSWLLSIPLFLIFLFGSEDMILYQAAYTNQMLWIVLCGALVYKIYENYEYKKLNKFLLVYEILLIFLLMGGIRMMAEQTIPVLIACLSILYMNARVKEKSDQIALAKKGLYMACVILVPSSVGYGIYQWMCSWHNVNNTDSNAIVFIDSLSSALNSFWSTICHFYNCFGFNGNVELISIDGLKNLISIFTCTIVCFIVPVLQGKKIKNESNAIKFFYMFGMIHNSIMFILAVFFGKSAASRYLLSSVFVMIIISCRYISEYWLKTNRLDRYLWIGAFIFSTTIQCTGIIRNSSEWTQLLYVRKEINTKLLEHGLTKGYATYWNAYCNEVYSDFRISFGGINLTESGIEPHLWLVDSDVYKKEDTHTFLLLTSVENDWYIARGQYFFEKPIDSFIINDMYVHVFDYDIIPEY